MLTRHVPPKAGRPAVRPDPAHDGRRPESRTASRAPSAASTRGVREDDAIPIIDVGLIDAVKRGHVEVVAGAESASTAATCPARRRRGDPARGGGRGHRLPARARAARGAPRVLGARTAARWCDGAERRRPTRRACASSASPTRSAGCSGELHIDARRIARAIARRRRATTEGVIEQQREPAGSLAVCRRARAGRRSIVTLALPELLTELDASVEGVAAVIGVYTLVLAAALLPAERLRRSSGRRASERDRSSLFAVGVRRLRRGALARGAARPARAPGAGRRRARSWPRSTCSARARAVADGRRLWTLAAVVGFAAGPALGGVLTQLFDWRSIFIVQAPVALAGAVVCARRGWGRARDLLAGFGRGAAPAWRALARPASRSGSCRPRSPLCCSCWCCCSWPAGTSPRWRPRPR